MVLHAHGIPWTIGGEIPRTTMEPLAAIPDGLSLDQWREANGCGQSTAYSLLKIVQRLGVPITRARLAGATKPSAVIEGQCADAMDRLLAEFKAGKSIKQMEAELDAMEGAASSAIAPAAPSAIAPQVDDEQDHAHDPSELMQRLQAAQLAQQTGIPLRKAEIEWILGCGVKTVIACNSMVRIKQTSRHGWQLMPPEL